MKETNYKELCEKLEQEVWDLQDESEMYENWYEEAQGELSTTKLELNRLRREYRKLEEIIRNLKEDNLELKSKNNYLHHIIDELQSKY